MTTQFLAASLIATFVLLAGVHVYWACGGRWLKGAAVPERNGRAAFVPGPLATLAVAAALLLFAGLVAAVSGSVVLPVPLRAGCLLVFALAALFLVRAVGDFRLVGFFKKTTGTRFARLDTAVYSPLCTVLALGLFTLALQRYR